MADAVEALWPENRAAWILSRTLFTRFASECRMVPLLLDRLTQDQDAETFADTLTRVSIIFDELYPPVMPEAET